MYSLVIWAWGSRSTHLPQIKADRRESLKCKKLQCSMWVLVKGLMLSAGLELRRGYRNEDHAGLQKLGKRADFRNIFTQSLALPHGLEKVPSESTRTQWLSLDCCQGTSAVLKPKYRQDAVFWVCRHRCIH